MTPAELLAGLGEAPGGGLLVALSGGADSAVAAWVAMSARRDAVRALHIHHGTAAADELAAAAAAVAVALGVPLESVAVDVPPGASWESRARDARWAALFAKAEPTDVIVTGHHKDDLAETTLGNLLRGAGARGLASIAAPRRDIWRPLVDFSRADLRSVAIELELPFVDDPANQDTTFARNRLRHEVLPQLEQVAPHTIDGLARTARLLAADDAALEAAAAAAPIRRDAWGAVAVAAALVTTAAPAVASRIARRLLREANPPYAGSVADVATVHDVAAGMIGAGEVSGGFRVEREGPLIVVHHGSVAAPPAKPMAIPGAAMFGRFEVAAVAPPSALIRRTALIDSGATSSSVTLRPAAAGERIEIAAGSKLIRDVLAEAEVPPRLRPAWPVVEAHGRIAAVAGIRAAPWARGALGEAGTVELTAREKQR